MRTSQHHDGAFGAYLMKDLRCCRCLMAASWQSTKSHYERVSYTSASPQIRDLPRSAGVPALAADKITTLLPLDAVRAARAVGVGHRRSTVRPPGEEVSVVDALLVGSDLALVQAQSWGGDDAADGGASREKSAEGDHVCVYCL